MEFIGNGAKVAHLPEVGIRGGHDICTRRVEREKPASLQDKIRHASVKKAVLESAGLRQVDEVVHRDRLLPIVKLDIDIPDKLVNAREQMELSQRPGEGGLSAANENHRQTYPRTHSFHGC